MGLATSGTAVLLPVAVSIGTILCTVVIHAIALLAIVHFVRRERRLGYAGVRFWKDVSIVAGAALVAFAAHLVETMIWALVFLRCGEFSDWAAAFFHSAENYTTLGYGDVVMSPAWRLLGPLEAADGMLMFGVSTAGLFAIIQRLLQTRFAGTNE
jgi:hypothetical protein